MFSVFGPSALKKHTRVPSVCTQLGAGRKGRENRSEVGDSCKLKALDLVQQGERWGLRIRPA